MKHLIKRYSVKIGLDAWLTSGNDGDPPRTMLRHSAQKFENEKLAIKRIEEVVKSHPQRKALTYDIYLDNICIKSIETKFGEILTPQ